jgi:hypothetical protein
MIRLMRSVAVVASMAGLLASASCKGSETPPAAPDAANVATYEGVHIPTSTEDLAPIPRDVTVVKLDGAAIVVAGQEVLRLVDGGVPDEALEGGSAGMVIGSLVDRLGGGRSSATPPSLLIVADASTPYDLIFQVGMSSQVRAFRPTWIAVAHGADLRAVRVRLPYDTSPPPGAAGADDEPPLQPIVSLGRDHLSLYSLSGAEGSAEKPLFRLDRTHAGTFDLQLLGRAAAGIVARHFLASPRSAESLRIAIVADRDVPLQTVVDHGRRRQRRTARKSSLSRGTADSTCRVAGRASAPCLRPSRNKLPGRMSWGPAAAKADLDIMCTGGDRGREDAGS